MTWYLKSVTSYSLTGPTRCWKLKTIAPKARLGQILLLSHDKRPNSSWYIHFATGDLLRHYLLTRRSSPVASSLRFPPPPVFNEAVHVNAWTIRWGSENLRYTVGQRIPWNHEKEIFELVQSEWRSKLQFCYMLIAFGRFSSILLNARNVRNMENF